MKVLKRVFPFVLPLLFLGTAMRAAAADFTQADLEKMVGELDPSIPHNPKYKYPIKCSIVDKDELNAYATLTKEGEDRRATMVVFTGLVKQIDGDKRLIRAVVAHELSHLSLGHSLEIDPAARDLRNLWTRQQEYAADKFGAEALVKAGFAKKDMVDMLLFLDHQQTRNGGGWLDRLTADHADPKARAASVSDNPAALNAMVTYDTALAYEDAREHLYAQKLFAYAGDQWPELTEAYINSGKCALLFYYDHLAKAVRSSWWRPDFGPLITNPHVTVQAVEITDEDRAAYRDAMVAINKAIDKNPNNLDALELLALAQVLEPDANKEVVQKGIDWFKGQQPSDPNLKLRYANNTGVGYQRLGDLQTAYMTIIAAQKATTKFNPALGENLGLVVVKGRSKADDQLAVDVLFTWLCNTPPGSPRWKTVKKTFDDICAAQGLTTKPIETRPGYLCQVTTLVTSNKHLGLFLPVSGLSSLLGKPDDDIVFTSKYPDMTEKRWHGEEGLSILTERDKVMRLTSYEAGAYLLLKPVDTTSTDEIKISVGMSKADLFAILNEKAAVMKDLAKGPKVEQWHYFPDLNMGVLIDGDKVKAITVTPVQYED